MRRGVAMAEARVQSALEQLGFSIEGGADTATLRAEHTALRLQVEALLQNVEEFKINTICEIHARATPLEKPERPPWFITPFEAYLRA